MRLCQLFYCGAAAVLAASAAPAEVPVQPGDIALGWSNGTATNTARQLRIVGGVLPPTVAGSWDRATFMQTPLFDSAGGIRHNHQGNLLFIDFARGGSAANGGFAIFNFSTDGTNGPAGSPSVGEIFRNGGGTLPAGSVSGATFGFAPTRAAYPAVSPGNDKIAYIGYDTGRLYVIAYDAGSAIGTGTGATIVGGAQSPVIALSTVSGVGISQGVEWLDNDTVVAYVVNPTLPQYEIYTIPVTRTGSSITIGTPVFQTFVQAPGVPANSRTLAIVYNPQICPFLFTLTSGFQSGVSVSQISAFDPTRFGDGPIRSAIEFSTSSQTSRNGAIGPDRYLYWAQFAGSTSNDAIDRINLDQNNDGVITREDLLLIADNSSETVATKAQTGLTGNANFPAIDIAIGAPSNMLACCTGTSCAVVMVGTCTGQALAAGSACTPVNPCVPVTGACCTGLVCVQETLANCEAANGIWTFNTACTPLPCKSELPVIGGDVAFGLSTPDASTTAQHVRGDPTGSLVGNWSRFPFIQDVEFDNAGGTLHSAEGNLLALDFGGTTTGARIYNLSTNGTNGGQFLYGLNNVPAQNPFGVNNTAATRATGLSVSPNNDKVAVYATDATRVVVFAYDAGSAVGTGSGAGFVGAAEDSSVPYGTSTVGTAWLNNSTLMVFGYNTFTQQNELTTYNVVRTGNAVTIDSPTFRATSTDTGVPNQSRFASIAYNPVVSPFVYLLSSGFDNTTNLSVTRVSVIDPATWIETQSISLGGSLNTGRDIAVGPDRRLYIGQFAQTTGAPYIDRLNLDVDGDSAVTSADLLTDDSSVNYWTRPSGGPGTSFNGLDVAFTPMPAPTGACCAGDGSCSVTTSAACTGAYQ
ncbi:MAG: hypothetical protein ACK4WH_13915, partial [Phycisphaerales bacterium]